MMSLKEELQAEQVGHLDLSKFTRVECGTTIRAALDKMRQEKYQVCLVTANGWLAGIFTERDLLRKVMPAPETLDEPIDNVMTHEPITVTPETPAAEALWLMDDHQFRNLPVVAQDGALIGNMTYATIINYLGARYPVEVLNRPPDPDQFPRKPEGGD
jgi:signal-transduction protein with cAMP-binding, CBS, and nucleotidyltransferase domain